MRRGPWFAIAVVVVCGAAGCSPGDSGDDAAADGGPGGRFQLEGVWVDEDDLVIAFDGDAARLVSFGRRVTGRQFFDVGDDYISEIRRVDDASFAGSIAQFDGVTADDGMLHLMGPPSYVTVRLTRMETRLDVLVGEDEPRRFDRSSRAADAYDYGGACEITVFGGDAQRYNCNDSGTAALCSTLFGETKFWKNTTCRQLGYAHELASAAFQHDAQHDDLPGAYGYWGDRSGGSGDGFGDGSGGSLLEEGEPGPQPSSDGGVANEDSGSPPAPADAATVENVRYLIYGVVWDSATNDCPEGSQIFDEAKAWYWQTVEGAWSDTYETASAAMESMMMTAYPGANSYDVESSWFAYGENATHAVVIDYTRSVPAWDCRPYLITIGYGTSFEEALASAIETKNNNDAASAPYTELARLTW